MTSFYNGLEAGLTHLHASNPEPWTREELEQLVNQDIFTIPNNFHCHYETSIGGESLRLTISENLYNKTAANHIITTTGAQEAIFCIMHAVLEKNDHIVVFTPIFEPLMEIPKRLECLVTPIPLEQKNNWQPDLNQLEESITKKTKMVIINFPHNPTGAHITQETLNDMINICKKRGCWLFSDEVFRGLEHNPENRISAAADCYQKGISLGVMSKAFALPAIRVGWIACQNTQLLDRIRHIKSQLSICHSLIDGYLTERIIPHHIDILERNRKIILTNKNILEEILKTCENLTVNLPVAGSTCFPIISNQTSENFVNALKKQEKILLLPNNLFNTKSSGFRLSLGLKKCNKYLKKIIDMAS